MRIVYDDTQATNFVDVVDKFLRGLDINSVVKYDYGTDRVQRYLIKEQLNDYISYCSMEIGNKVTHKNGIGNNCNYPVYYKQSDNEIQEIAYINMNSGLYDEVYISIEDYNGKRISYSYEITRRGLKIK